MFRFYVESDSLWVLAAVETRKHSIVRANDQNEGEGKGEDQGMGIIPIFTNNHRLSHHYSGCMTTACFAIFSWSTFFCSIRTASIFFSTFFFRRSFVRHFYFDVFFSTFLTSVFFRSAKSIPFSRTSRWRCLIVGEISCRKRQYSMVKTMPMALFS